MYKLGQWQKMHKVSAVFTYGHYNSKHDKNIHTTSTNPDCLNILLRLQTKYLSITASSDLKPLACKVDHVKLLNLKLEMKLIRDLHTDYIGNKLYQVLFPLRKLAQSVYFETLRMIYF